MRTMCDAFYDINPQAPTHILIIPKKRIERPDLIDKADEEVVVTYSV